MAKVVSSGKYGCGEREEAMLAVGLTPIINPERKNCYCYLISRDQDSRYHKK